MQNISLAGWRIVIAGGDARDVILAEQLKKAGADVWLCGFEKCALPKDASLQKGKPEFADVLILPLPGVNSDGTIYATYAEEKLFLDDLSPLFKPGLLLICGRMPTETLALLEERKIRVVLTAEMDELAVYNAVPTAEGTIELAMRESDVTIHGSKALVIGFGRCGLPLAKTLAALGARVTVGARRREVLAQAETFGFAQLDLAKTLERIGDFDFIFNTVPAMVLTDKVLGGVNKEALVIDIASKPGGTDFAAAKRLGLKTFLALGLPGKVAPKSAGNILARVYPHIITEMGKGGA
ncbi:dipicolinate synthase subunit DpsA [Dethiobacter alkaliphilus]|uniref:dipicolinate synthase subunit DpsA n=1 Tax=Dethiobacter alkaliphilus TaxID=427926 RepID=UPI002227E46A|nr:dipicolinate synthase subunit DpsA [Dethiobacter alkaliphilus]MCW3490823.1 dipicolinate synthase subunit DpsA [Dethiobacter alkaliphilus]